LEIWKSARTLTPTVVVRLRPPAEAVIVTVYEFEGVDADVEMVSVEEYWNPGCTEKLLGLNDRVGALAGDGETEPVRDTVPVRPRLVRLIVDVEDPEATKLSGDGALAEIWMSGLSVRLIEMVCTSVPLVAVTVIV